MISGASAPDEPAPVSLDPAALPTPPSALGERFAAARRAPGYHEALTTHVAARDGAQRGQLVIALGFLAFGVLFGARWMSHAPGDMQAGGAIFFVLWFAAAGTMARRAWLALSAPQVTHLACVRSRESATVVHRTEHRTRITQRVMLELEDGRRVSLGGEDSVVGTLVDGDVGVAYVKGERLVGFRRLAA